jgi:hypothetical protein
MISIGRAKTTLTQAEYDACANATTEVELNAAIQALVTAHGGLFPADYEERITGSGLMAAVAGRFATIKDPSGAQLTSAELAAIDNAPNADAMCRALLALERPDSKSPSNYKTALIDTNRLLAAVNKFARPRA